MKNKNYMVNKIKIFVAKVANKLLLEKKFASGICYSTDPDV